MDVTTPDPDRFQHVTVQCRKVSAILSRVGDKWTVLVVMLLGGGPRRFNDIKRQVDGISLERDGLVRRTVTPTIPPRVDYELTPAGFSLLEPVQALGAWAQAHIETIEAARSAFDAKAG